MMLRILLFSIIMTALSGTVWAQVCDERSSVADVLSEKYKESEVATGIVSKKTFLQLFAKKDGSTWTVVLTGADGFSCLHIVGKNLSTGNLGKITDIYPDETYPNLVAIGSLKNGHRLTVITNSDLQWKMLNIGPVGIGMPLFEGDVWDTIVIPSDQEI